MADRGKPEMGTGAAKNKFTREQAAIRVSSITIAGNILLSGFKLFAGISANSAAMVSDAVHSASDVLSTVVVIVGVKLAGRRPDRGHPYGHERMECVAALLLSVMLGATGVGIGAAGVRKIAAGTRDGLSPPGSFALAAAVVSVFFKEVMYWYTRAAGKRIRSGALMADAWHHRSDALSSVGSFAGILGARLGIPVLDPAAGVVICLFILKVAADIFRDSINKMVDKSCDEKTLEEIRNVILSQEGVLGIDDLKTRLFGDKIYVDVEIRMDGYMELYRSHEVAQMVHDRMERNFPLVKHCMVHVNPVVFSADTVKTKGTDTGPVGTDTNVTGTDMREAACTDTAASDPNRPGTA